VFWSNFASCDSIHRKNRSRLAMAKRLALNIGWYGMGRPFRRIMPSTAAPAANRMVVSNAGTMNDGQLWNGRPPMLNG
jgi:cytochrome c peroxidase